MNSYKIINLRDLYTEIGEDECNKILSDYSCPVDADLGYFLHEKAIQFDKMDVSRTYLVFTQYKGENRLCAYFAIANKSMHIGKHVSATLRKKIIGLGYKTIDYVAVYLIGQLGKSYTDKLNELITGEELLKFALMQILKVHAGIGGRIIMVECKDEQNLIEFYTKHGFVRYGENAKENLIQFIKSVNSIS